jgi:hypothetical protein
MVFFSLPRAHRRRGLVFTSAQLPRATLPFTRVPAGRRGYASPLFFLLKSLICIGLVLFALGWPEVEPAPTAPHGRAVAAAPQPPRRPQIQDHARDLAQAGADALMGAARDKCLAAPRDCAALLQSLAGGKSERQ